MARDSCIGVGKDGILLFVRLTPNASCDEVLGVEDGADGQQLKAKVRAIADKGKANKSLLTLISNWLGLPKRTIELKTGSRSRSKTLHIAGDPQELIQLVTHTLETEK